MEKRRELTDEEKAKLQMEFERAQEEVDEDDVKYVLAKTEKKAEKLSDSDIVRCRCSLHLYLIHIITPKKSFWFGN